LSSTVFCGNEKLRVYGLSGGDKGVSASESIDLLRNDIAIPQSSTRIVGLSGVGKTRFVQALFDKNIGEAPSETNLVVYTDMSFSPDPSPDVLMDYLIEEGQRIIFIVDNCKPSLHTSLTKRCKGISLALVS